MRPGFKVGDIINNKAQPGLIGIVIGQKRIGQRFHRETSYIVLTLNKRLNYISKSGYHGPDEWLEVVDHFDLTALLRPVDMVLNQTSDRLFPETKDIELHLKLGTTATGNIIDIITKEDSE